MATRRFTVRAGDVIDGFTVPRTITEVIEYSKSEMNPSQAQKAALRRVQRVLREDYGVSASQAAIQRGTAVTNKATGRARGGRIPDRLKVEGFRIRETKRRQQGIRMYTWGSERGPSRPDAHARIERMVVAAFERHPGARVAVAVHGKSINQQSPKRYKSDNLPFWRKGDIIPGSRTWAQTSQVASPEAWERVYGTADEMSAWLDVDMRTVNAATVIVREG